MKGDKKRVPISYRHIDHNSSHYTVGTIVRLNGDKYDFVIDFEDFEKIKDYKWHIVSGYIGSDIINDNKAKALYLHNVIMDKLTFDGKGQKETVDHINRNPMDNRKCNLRILTQGNQNMNQKKKPRKFEYPPEYNLNPEDLPKNITYVAARGNHGDGFCVEFISNGKRLYNPYIRSKVLSTEEKLEKIKVLLEKGYELYPEYNPNYEKELRDKLEEEYKSICQLPV